MGARRNGTLHQHNGAPPPPRTAVVVIAGVGDNPSGSASEALAGGLLRYGGDRFGYAQCPDEEYSPGRRGRGEENSPRRGWFGEDPEPSQSVRRHTLFTPEGVPVAD